MKNLLSPETAQKLKAAGFPQPEPGAAQYWYDNEILYWVQSVGSYRADVREVGKSQSAFFEFASRRASDAKYAKDVNSERTYSAVAKWANARMVDMCVKIHMEYILGK
jgi:hypothetical protein